MACSAANAAVSACRARSTAWGDRARRCGSARSRPRRTGCRPRHRRLHTASLQNRRAADTLFSEDAIGLIHNASRGHPRAVNNLALHALTAAFAAEHAIVDENAARIAISENAAD